MNCPHCGKLIPRKTNGHGAYQEDVGKAEAALMALERAMSSPDAFRTKTKGFHDHAPSNVVFVAACASEVLRLVDAIENPAKLYAIYRRGDRKTPVGYGMGT